MSLFMLHNLALFSYRRQRPPLCRSDMGGLRTDTTTSRANELWFNYNHSEEAYFKDVGLYISIRWYRTPMS
jgi:hypothetical protein